MKNEKPPLPSYAKVEDKEGLRNEDKN